MGTLILKSLVYLVFFFSQPFFFGAANSSDEFSECGIRSAHPLATQAGCDVLKKGGNAFDAAVAVSSVLAVVEPFSSGIGGGGFYLLHLADNNANLFLDAREMAPLQSSPDQYVRDGKAIGKLSVQGPMAAAIPGIPAALDKISRDYGNLSLPETMSYSIELANKGFPIDERYRKLAKYRLDRLRQDPVTADIFLYDDDVPPEGWFLKQEKLSDTLSLISRKGATEFYQGAIAEGLVDCVRTAGGVWTKTDLKNYKVITREPLSFHFRGAKITTAPLPSSGGLVMAQVLQIMDGFDLETLDDMDFAHLLAEAMKRGYSDRAIYMGDPDFIEVPVERLSSVEYADQRRSGISLSKATPSRELSELHSFSSESSETTHFSIIDSEGNRVSATLSINGLFGAAFTAGDTGVLLNNHMNDFVLAPGIPNMYGLIGTTANLIQPQKRPLSSMSPTFVEDKRGVLILGTPGGSRIISMVILGILDFMLNTEVDAYRMVAEPRFHHQFIPDTIEVEPEGFSEEWISVLENKGHKVKIGSRKWGNMQVIFFDKKTGRTQGANDPRGR